MKSIVSFVAYRADWLKSKVRTSRTSEQSVTVELSDGAFRNLSEIVKPNTEYSIQIELDESSQTYHDITKIITTDLGLTPSYFTGVGVKRGEEYVVSRKYIYTHEEIDSAQALMVLPTKTITEIKDIKDGVPQIKSRINKSEFGVLFPTWRFAIKSNLALKLSEENLLGLDLVEVKKGEVFWMKPNIFLPLSELSLVDSRTGKTPNNRTKGYTFLSKSDPHQLIYKKHKFKALDFDIAFTKEKVGNGELNLTENLVISQKARRVLETHLPYSLDYIPIKLID